jgi:hypothetical protein
VTPAPDVDIPAVKGKRHMLCWGHTCGKCRFGKTCIFIHIDGKDLNDGFATEFSNKVKPGVEYLAKQPAGKDKSPEDGAASKKQRHS